MRQALFQVVCLTSTVTPSFSPGRVEGNTTPSIGGGHWQRPGQANDSDWPSERHRRLGAGLSRSRLEAARQSKRRSESAAAAVLPCSTKQLQLDSPHECKRGERQQQHPRAGQEQPFPSTAHTAQAKQNYKEKYYSGIDALLAFGSHTSGLQAAMLWQNCISLPFPSCHPIS